MKQSMLIVLCCILAGCTSESDTVRTLHAAGYSDVHTTGWSPLACGEDDQFKTGTVCCGFMFKGCTIRF